MAGLFDGLRAALNRKQPTAEDLEAAVGEAAETHRRATERLAGLEASRSSPETLATDGALPRLRLTLQAARDEVEDAAAYLAELGRRHAAAVRTEAEAARLTRYREAQAALAKGAKAFGPAYTKAVAQLVDVIRNTAEIDLLVGQANADLPAGAEALATVESRVRDRPGQPQETHGPVQREVWAYRGIDQIIPPAAQKRVEDFGDGTGVVLIGTTRHQVERRRILETSTIDAVPGEQGPRVAALVLPGLRVGDSSPFGPPLFDPYSNALNPAAWAASVLRRLEEPSTSAPPPSDDRFERSTHTFLPREPAKGERKAA